MKRITNEDFRELAAMHDLHCVSVFIPTHRAGVEVKQQEDALLFKNQLKEVKIKLAARGMNEIELEEFMKPLERLVDEGEYWTHQSEGLALFYSNNEFRKYELPVKFDPWTYVSGEFYLKPLIAGLALNQEFFLLSLELEDLHLYKGTLLELEEIDIAKRVPAHLEEVVGEDYEQKYMQARSQKGGYGHSIYHGHGEGKDEKKMEVKKYLQAVDEGLMTFLKGERVPLVIAGVDYLFSAFKEVNSYENLFPQHISGNPTLIGEKDLHGRAWEMLQPFFNQVRTEKSNVFMQYQGTPRTANSIDEIVPAAVQGKIDTLFIAKGIDAFGLYNIASGKVETGKENGLAEVSLFNLAAVEALLHGASVYEVEKEEIPDGFSEINALYRYE